MQQPYADKLPLRIKLAFGAPHFAGAAMIIPILIHMSKFYADVVLLPLGYVALAIACARVFDALTDPAMGWLSDRTRTRFGRRRPWMAIGAPLCAVAFIALFSPPADMGTGQAATWFAATFLLYTLFHTVYVIPHDALGAELTMDHHERSSLYGWGVVFTIGGTMCAALLPEPLSIHLGGQREGLRAFAMIFAGLLVVLYAWQVLGIRERPEFVRQESNPLVPGVRRVLRNRPFLLLLAVLCTGSIMGLMPAVMIPFFTQYIVMADDFSQWYKWLGLLLGAHYGVGILVLPLWVWASRRYGKRETLLGALVVGIVGCAGLALTPVGQPLWAVAFIGILGNSSAAVLFLNSSIKADVIDYDELCSGKRREGQYLALWSIVSKFVAIPSAAMPLAILAILGYEPNVAQSDTVQLAIRILQGLLPALMGCAAFAFAWRYPIDEAAHRAIRAGVAAHSRGEPARDPLTGRDIPPNADNILNHDQGWFLDHFSAAELRGNVQHQGSWLRRMIWRRLLVALAVLLAAAAWVISSLSTLDQQPGFGVVCAMAVGGAALALAVFHGLRLHAARQLHNGQKTIDQSAIEAHIQAASKATL